jgi:hypothetical protein
MRFFPKSLREDLRGEMLTERLIFLSRAGTGMRGKIVDGMN